MKLFLIILAFVIFLVAVFYGIWLLGKRYLNSAIAYDKLHDEIRDNIFDGVDSEIIKRKIKRLDAMKYKDKEKTHVLQMQFLRSYYQAEESDMEFLPDIDFDASMRRIRALKDAE